MDRAWGVVRKRRLSQQRMHRAPRTATGDAASVGASGVSGKSAISEDSVDSVQYEQRRKHKHSNTTGNNTTTDYADSTNPIAQLSAAAVRQRKEKEAKLAHSLLQQTSQHSQDDVRASIHNEEFLAQQFVQKKNNSSEHR